MTNIRKFNQINVKIHEPASISAKDELARRAANVHADFVLETIKKINCPIKQKNALLNAVKRRQKELGK